MICKFYPFPVTATVAAVSVNPVNGTPADAAAELSSIIEWILWNPSDGQ